MMEPLGRSLAEIMPTIFSIILMVDIFLIGFLIGLILSPMANNSLIPFSSHIKIIYSVTSGISEDYENGRIFSILANHRTSKK